MVQIAPNCWKKSAGHKRYKYTPIEGERREEIVPQQQLRYQDRISRPRADVRIYTEPTNKLNNWINKPIMEEMIVLVTQRGWIREIIIRVILKTTGSLRLNLWLFTDVLKWIRGSKMFWDWTEPYYKTNSNIKRGGDHYYKNKLKISVKLLLASFDKIYYW